MTSVLLITVDSLRADHVGCYDYSRDTTPYVDSLAEKGTNINAFSNANSTRYSFPSMLSSTYPLSYGGGERLSEERPFVTDVLTDMKTGGFHSNVWLSREYGYDRGFDKFYDAKSDPSLLGKMRMWVKDNLDSGYLMDFLTGVYEFGESQVGVDLGRPYKDATTTTNIAIDWWNEKKIEDTFAWVHYMDPHHPYTPQSEEHWLHDEAMPSEREAMRLRNKINERGETPTPEEHEMLVALYDNEIRYMDSEIRRLVESFESCVQDDFMGILTADHGEEFADHGGYNHSYTMYDEVISVPLVVWGDYPVSRDKAQLIDILPTICDVTDSPKHQKFRGTSLFDDPDDVFLFENTKNGTYKHAARTDKWKYIWDKDTEEIELYNLEKDPREMQDVSDEKPKTVERFHTMLTERSSEIGEQAESVKVDQEMEERLEALGYR